jgi:hypothetical protein
MRMEKMIKRIETTVTGIRINTTKVPGSAGERRYKTLNARDTKGFGRPTKACSSLLPLSQRLRIYSFKEKSHTRMRF